MEVLSYSDEKKLRSKSQMYNQQVSERDGKRILHIHLFAFTITLTLNKKRMTMEEYDDQKRVKKIREDLLSKHAQHIPFQ
ncbi:putative sporulation protein YrzI [Scopulibacillus darangshiensis]|uniref:Putative sporulation protein YrzI n=1 Tax=Scopulibacillus darangshiensis TaxID=442528 RepID=A0A4R2PEE9_9BACL|nr:YrzI family small protein [Scopulibacillus darangshiensis]TCP32305.1 putative sporulation protein YrzI [Scopulibacillus darangshiensis]